MKFQIGQAVKLTKEALDKWPKDNWDYNVGDFKIGFDGLPIYELIDMDCCIVGPYHEDWLEAVVPEVKLTRMEKRTAIFSNYPRYSIPQICMMWREAFSGASDSLTNERNQIILKFLRCCVETWETSIPPHELFDNAVIQLILATINEAAHFGIH